MRKIALLILLGTASMQAGVLFSDNFESGNLSLWATAGTGSVVNDPLNGANKVLHFGGLLSGGDIYSPLNPYTLGTQLTLDFDYLQVSVEQSQINPFAYVGTDHVTSGWTFEEQWLLTTAPGSGTSMENLSFDVWHHISLTFNPYDPNVVGSIALKIEQNGGVPGTAYFDNVVLSEVPEPSTLSFLALGLAALPALRRLRRLRR